MIIRLVGVNTTGRSVVIGEELATYDKVIMMEDEEEVEEGRRCKEEWLMTMNRKDEEEE